MSDLKHQSPAELRHIIQRSEKYRAGLEHQIAVNEEASRLLLEQSDELRKKIHNAGQREAWARIYLARST